VTRNVTLRRCPQGRQRSSRTAAGQSATKIERRLAAPWRDFPCATRVHTWPTACSPPGRVSGEVNDGLLRAAAR
jgi:hypothetical protein